MSHKPLSWCKKPKYSQIQIRAFAMIEQNTVYVSFKSIAIEAILVKPGRFMTFQSFVGQDYGSPGKYIFCLPDMFFV